jgi:hypothetical protein
MNNPVTSVWSKARVIEIFQGGIQHCVQTDPAKNVWTRAYVIPERNRTEGKKKVRILFIFLFFLHELGGNKCFINHFLLSDETFWLCHRILIEK